MSLSNPNLKIQEYPYLTLIWLIILFINVEFVCVLCLITIVNVGGFQVDGGADTFGGADTSVADEKKIV